MDVMYAVVMDGGKGPPVGLWRNEETAREVCAKQPPGHKDVVVAVAPASVVDDLTRQLAEANRRAEVRREFAAGMAECNAHGAHGDEDK